MDEGQWLRDKRISNSNTGPSQKISPSNNAKRANQESGKWALGSITVNKASGGDGIPAELFQILNDDAVKALHSICQFFGKLSSGHRTGKGQSLL